MTVPMFYLDPSFVAADTDTNSLIKDLHGRLDGRKKGVANYDACHRVLAGILALRHHGYFRVIKVDLSPDHQLAWDAIKDSSLLGYLFLYEGGKGNNVFRVHPKFTHPSKVRDTRSELGFRVTGRDVSYGSSAAIQHPSQVRLLNGRLAVTCTIKGAQTAFQMLLCDAPFPPRYQNLPALQDETLGQLKAAAWVQFLEKQMSRWGYVGVIPSSFDSKKALVGERSGKGQPNRGPAQDFNDIPIVLLAEHAHEFNDWAYQVSLPFFREHKLPSATFPLRIFHKDWTQLVDGIPIQQLREQMANVSPVRGVQCASGTESVG